MKPKILWLFVILLSIVAPSAYGHELNFGIFDLYEDGDAFYMEIRLDKDYTLEALEVSNEVKSVDSFTCELTAYIDENLSLSINELNATWEYVDFSSNDEVIVIKAKMNVPHQSVSEIKVYNTVLLATVENQNNIIKVPFHQRNRSFRLNAKRTSTTIQY